MFIEQFAWKEFRIDLNALYNHLEQNLENFDGIFAQNEHFDIIKKEEFTLSDLDMINNYLNSLTEEGEATKLNRPALALKALEKCKTEMLTKSYSQLSILERKIILNLELSESDIDVLIQTHS